MLLLKKTYIELTSQHVLSEIVVHMFAGSFWMFWSEEGEREVNQRKRCSLKQFKGLISCKTNFLSKKIIQSSAMTSTVKVLIV